jgi:hypothetical protein
MLIISGKLAMTDFVATPSQRSLPIFSFTNPLAVRQLEQLFCAIRDDCHPISSHLVFRRAKDMILFIGKRMYADNPIYIYDYFPFCFPVSHALMRKVLRSNGFSEGHEKAAMRFYNDIVCKPLLATNYRFPKRFIINGAMLAGIASKDAYIYPPNLISDMPITIPHEFFADFFEEIVAYLEQPSERRCIEFAIIENDPNEFETGFMSITKQNLFTFVSGQPQDMHSRSSMLFSNPELIADAWQFYDELWFRLPEESKRISGITAQLMDVIRTLKNL